jgi:hypothetical protein
MPYTEKKLENLRLLCQHTTLTTLEQRARPLYYNNISAAGAQALAANTTITNRDF